MAKRGRKPIEIDIREVEEAAADGLTEGEVAARLGISIDTLGRRKNQYAEYAEAIKRGKQRAHAAVSSKLMALVRKGNLGAIVWYEKTRKGYSDRVQQELSGRDGEAIEIKNTVFNHEAAVASLAARSAEHYREPGEVQNRGDGETVG
jgi:hypothetical protein